MKTKYALAIDIGGTKVSFAIVSETGDILRSHKTPTYAELGGEAVLNSIILQAKGFVAGYKNQYPEVYWAGIGIGTAGDVDRRRGIIVYSTDAIPGWKGIRLKDEVQNAFGLPTYVVNDGNAMILGELTAGAGKGLHNVIGLTIGTGVGGGIVIDGNLYLGSTGFAGGLGHIVIDIQQKRRCACGKFGCLEAYAPGPAIVRSFLENYPTGTAMPPGIDQERVDVEKISALAASGNQEAIRAITESAMCLGMGTASLINIFNPDAVIIGGGVAEIGSWYFDEVIHHARAQALPCVTSTPILPAALGPNANLLGAASLVFHGLGNKRHQIGRRNFGYRLR